MTAQRLGPALEEVLRVPAPCSGRLLTDLIALAGRWSSYVEVSYHRHGDDEWLVLRGGQPTLLPAPDAPVRAEAVPVDASVVITAPTGAAESCAPETGTQGGSEDPPDVAGTVLAWLTAHEAGPAMEISEAVGLDLEDVRRALRGLADAGEVEPAGRLGWRRLEPTRWVAGAHLRGVQFDPDAARARASEAL